MTEIYYVNGIVYLISDNSDKFRSHFLVTNFCLKKLHLKIEKIFIEKLYSIIEQSFLSKKYCKK